MKSIAFIMISLFIVATANAEYHDYNKFQKIFELPLDAKNVQVQSIEYKNKFEVGFNWDLIPNCDTSYWDCRKNSPVYKSAVAVRVTFESRTGVNSYNVETISEVYTHFEATEFTVDQIKGIPKVGLFGNGEESNKDYAQKLIKSDVRTILEKRNIVDKNVSYFCSTDVDGNKLNSTCEDKIVYKIIDVPVRFLKLSVTQ